MQIAEVSGICSQHLPIDRGGMMVPELGIPSSHFLRSLKHTPESTAQAAAEGMMDPPLVGASLQRRPMAISQPNSQD